MGTSAVVAGDESRRAPPATARTPPLGASPVVDAAASWDRGSTRRRSSAVTDPEADPVHIWLAMIPVAGLSMWLTAALVPPERPHARSLHSAEDARRALP